MRHYPPDGLMRLADGTPFEWGMTLYSGVPHRMQTVTPTNDSHEVHRFVGEKEDSFWLVPKMFPRLDHSMLYHRYHDHGVFLLRLCYPTPAKLARAKVETALTNTGFSCKTLEAAFTKFGDPGEGKGLQLVREIQERLTQLEAMTK